MGVPAPGSYAIGSAAGRILLRTYRQGIAAAVGHDLVIDATRWEGTVEVPDDPAEPPRVTVRVDLDALEVREGSGGAKPLTDDDREQIRETLRKLLATGHDPTATYQSRGVERRGAEVAGATIEGDLTVAGVTAPLHLVVRSFDGRLVEGSATVTQSAWGIKPYSGFFGALRLRDEVDVEFVVTLVE